MKIIRPVSKNPLPKNAKLVFKGKIFDVYQWPQKQYDGTTVVFEKLGRPDFVSVVIIDKDNQIILGKQSQPNRKEFIGCFGGRLEKDEDPLTGAKRELMEETGYAAGKWEIWFSGQTYDKIDCAAYTFITRDLKKVSGQRLDAGEKIKLKKVSFDEFLKIAATEKFRDREVSLHIFRIMSDPKKFKEMKKLFLSL
jgi:8-oxo-dGTP pyrophosphatase MutT (NUDIX family)